MERLAGIEELEHWRPDPHADLTGWLAAAALLWVEVFGILGLAIASIAAPMGCGGDPAPGSPGLCPDGVPFYNDHLGILWLILLGTVLAIVAMVWIATDGYVGARGAAFLSIGAIGIAAIIWQVLGGPVFIPYAIFWLSPPSLMFVRAGTSLLRRARSGPRE